MRVLVGLVFVAACGGVLVQDDAGSSQDAGIVPPPTKDGSMPIKDGGEVDTMTSDVIAVDATPCTGAICDGICVDTQSDPTNCGACGNVCDSGTCAGGKCANAKEPPVGSCEHSLCQLGGPLTEGCDPCSKTICAQNGVPADTYCCLTSWDNLCTQEVAPYCPPYACE